MAEEEWSFAEGPISRSDPGALFAFWAPHLERAASLLQMERLALSVPYGRKLEALEIFRRAPASLGPGLDAWLADEFAAIRGRLLREAEYAEERDGLGTRNAQTSILFEGHSLALREVLPQALRAEPESRAKLMDLRLQRASALGEYRRRLLEGRAERSDRGSGRARRPSPLILLPDTISQAELALVDTQGQGDLELSARVLAALLERQESPKDAGDFLARRCFLGAQGEYPARLDGAAVLELLGGQAYRAGLQLPAFPLPARLSPGSFFLALERAMRAEWTAYAPARGPLDFMLGAEIWGSLPLARAGRAAYGSRVLGVARQKLAAHREAARAALISELLLLSLRVQVDEACRSGVARDADELMNHSRKILGQGASQDQVAGLFTRVSAPGELLRARLLGVAWDRLLMDLYDEDYFLDPRAIGELRARLSAGIEFAADAEACARGLAAILADE